MRVLQLRVNSIVEPILVLFLFSSKPCKFLKFILKLFLFVIFIGKYGYSAKNPECFSSHSREEEGSREKLRNLRIMANFVHPMHLQWRRLMVVYNNLFPSFLIFKKFLNYLILCFHFQFIILLYFCLESLNRILSGWICFSRVTWLSILLFKGLSLFGFLIF